jgi:hypothetical protein
MLIKDKFIFRQLLLDRTEPYRSPAVHELVMDVDGVVVDGDGTGVVAVWRMIEARGRNIS